MPSTASTAECTKHILSIQPTGEELTAFHTLHRYLEDLRPLPVVNFIHRWMHRHSFYNICPSKASTLLALTSTLILLAKLPTTDDIKDKVAQKCASLITESALKWEEGGLLRQRGNGLGKRALFRDIWAAYADRFHEVEKTILWEVSAEGQQGINGSRTNGVVEDRSDLKKVSSTPSQLITLIEGQREANTDLSHDIAKIPRTGYERAGRDEARQHEMPGPNGDDCDCIIVGVGESSLAELGLPECSSPRKPDATDHESPLSPPADNREGTSASNCTEEGGAIPFELSSSDEASGVSTTSPDQIQEVARHRTSSNQRPPTAAPEHNTAPQSPLAPASAPEHLNTITSSNVHHLDSSEQAPEMQSNTHIPRRSSSPPTHISTQYSPPDSRRQISGHDQEPWPQSATQASPIASVGMRACPPSTGPSHPVSPGCSPQVSNHVKHVPPGDPAILEPLITIDGTPDLPQIAPKSPDSSQPLIGSTERTTPTARSGPYTTSSQMFQVVGKVLTPNYNLPRTWSLLHVDTLMSRNVTQFYNLFPRLAQPDVLKFELLDVAPELTPDFSNSAFISCDDDINFQAWKKSVFTCFKATMAKYPSLQMFRIMATLDLSPLSHQISVGVGAEGPGNSSSRAQWPVLGTSSSFVRLSPSELRLGSQDSPTRCSSNAPSPSYNETSLSKHPNFWEDRESRGFHLASAAWVRKHKEATANKSPLPTVVVRIQVSKHGSISGPFPKTVLGPKVTNAEFFSWFAKQTGYGGPLGPAELSFSFKDVVPAPKNNVITRGNEEYFQYMKRDIQPMYETTMDKFPGLSEFAILVTVPGWVSEKQDEMW